MLVHIVMFNFKEKNKKTNIIQAKQMLEQLMGTVPSLRSMDIGLNIIEADRAMDLSIISVFESKEGLDAYDIHPAHQEVLIFIKSVVEYSKSCDYLRD
ncbi:MAG: Dabb family protein [Epsilonproteobacteria bacterium]|nr:MAG: Dabb family protein [Campylobacterota bacterium]